MPTGELGSQVITDVDAYISTVLDPKGENLSRQDLFEALFGAVEDWVGVQDSLAAVSSNTVLTATSARTTKMTTGAGDKTVTLPAGATVRDGQRFRVTKADGGAGKCTLHSAGADTIDGVAAATGVDIDSQYDYVEVEWMAGYWTIPPGGYKDHGSDSDGYWERRSNGTMEQWDQQDKTITVTNYIEAITYPKQFDTITPTVWLDQEAIDTTGGSILSQGAITTTGFTWRNAGATIQQTVARMWKATGRWRT